MTGGPVAVVWDDAFLAYDFGPQHPFTEVYRHLAVELLQKAGLLGTRTDARLHHLSRVKPADRAVLKLFHDRDYLDRVERLSRKPGPDLLDRGDTPSFPGCWGASASLVGGTLLAWHEIRDGRAVHAINPGGGLHHAKPDGASGFCIFNDLAVAMAEALQGPSPLSRIAYIDIDAHHGDGVMYGFYDDGRVLDIDFHQDGRSLFPGTGTPDETGRGDGIGKKINIPLPPGAGDEAFLPLFRRLVPPLVRDFKPELIVLQTGVDGHVGDPLAHLQYTPRAYREALAIVHDLAHEVCGGRLLETGGGGYRAASVSRVLATCAAQLAGIDLHATPVPATWQRWFQEAVQEEAPVGWDDIPPSQPSPWQPNHEAKIVRVLEDQLGRRFPAVPLQATGSK